MKAFYFVALNSSGEKKRGTVRARSLSEAKKVIQRSGYYLASIEIQDSSVSHDQSFFSCLKKLREFFLSREKISI
jgi:type II secretory pathway component PulF